jgi:hypothetical protein
MRNVALVVLILLAASPVRADEIDPALVLAEAKPFRDAWERCAAGAVKALAPSARPAAAVADLALARCRTQERALERKLASGVGRASAARVMTVLRDSTRSSLVEVVARLRQRRSSR